MINIFHPLFMCEVSKLDTFYDFPAAVSSMIGSKNSTFCGNGFSCENVISSYHFDVYSSPSRSFNGILSSWSARILEANYSKQGLYNLASVGPCPYVTSAWPKIELPFRWGCQKPLV